LCAPDVIVGTRNDLVKQRSASDYPLMPVGRS
jgi:hypothetical protein